MNLPHVPHEDDLVKCLSSARHTSVSVIASQRAPCIGTRNKESAPGDLSPVTLFQTQTAPPHLGDFSEIKSRDLTLPVSFLATSLDNACMPFVVV